MDQHKKEGISNPEMIASFSTKPKGKGKTLVVGKAYSKLCKGTTSGEKDIYVLELYINRGKAARYKVTYNLNGGTLSNPVYAYSTSADLKLSIPKKTGYKFAGWEKNVPHTANIKQTGKTLTIKKGSTGAVSFTATWIKK